MATEPILPIEGKRNILITSALPYVNNVPHLGNIVGSVLSADAFARYSRLRGHQTLYICGTDEYGTATETKALEEKVTPQELCDKYYALHKETYDWFNISFDKFGRTPTKQQTDIAQDIFTKLYENGYLEERTTLQPFCEHPDHMKFLADRFVEGTCPRPGCGYEDARGDQCDKCGSLLDPLELINPHCKLDNATPIPKNTTHVFLLLDKLQDNIDKWQAEASTKGSWSENGIKITQSWLKKGLEPRGITRDLSWGTAVPLAGYDQKVLYVWFDACIGYVSITANYTDEWEKWWRSDDVQLYQFMGKDNVPFHTVIFPGSQIGTGQKWTKLHHLSTTEYLNYEHGKFSKSRGVGVFGINAKDTGVPSDVWRYYLLSHRPETSDSEFEWPAFISDNNNELLKNLGNFVNRIVKFVNSKTYDGVVPSFKSTSDPLFEEHRRATNERLKEYVTDFDAVKLRAPLIHAMYISYLGNKLLQDSKLDNKLAESEPDKCAQVVGLALNHVHLLASLISPYMPSTAESILTQLNASPLQIPDEYAFDTIKPGYKIGEPAYLFTQIKPEKEQEWRDAYGGKAARKAREEAVAAAAAKKASRKKPKEGKEAVKEPEKSVEAVEKDGADTEEAGTALEEVTEGVENAVLQTS
ncbi:methionyl-tRNA synthetase [Tothia fuscella]|uniref:methionine--tRNA ligase n=1 Tax=Tothia fuscella TaxID=1048955 RepID=A0A9P4NSY1_9PEZI|nr:methionyl-tRNA synthetase [Tothia fuscella]